MITFEIHIKNWEKHNPNKKKNHRYFLLENRFFNDTKILSCSVVDAMLFINCLALAADSCSSRVVVCVKSFSTQLRLTTNSLHTRLVRLQQLQLLTVEKIDSLIIQEKIKEEKTRKKDKLTSNFDPEKNHENTESKNLQFFQEKIIEKIDSFPKSNLKDNCKKLWETYKISYMKRYGIEPKRNVKVNSQIKQLAQRLGVEDASKTIEFYLTHNDSLYLKTSHNIGLCLQNAENLFSEMQRGVQITQSKINTYNKQAQYQDFIDDITKNGI